MKKKDQTNTGKQEDSEGSEESIELDRCSVRGD